MIPLRHIGLNPFAPASVMLDQMARPILNPDPPPSMKPGAATVPAQSSQDDPCSRRDGFSFSSSRPNSDNARVSSQRVETTRIAAGERRADGIRQR